MLTIKILHRYTNACLWEGEAESLRDAIKKALSSADLSYANLRSADLSHADLSSADLSYADLSYANLRSANLRSANLSYANLSSANLPEKFPMCRMDFGGWSIWIRVGKTSIGCQTHDNAEWLKWKPEDRAIKVMANGASEFWANYGPAIKATIEAIEAINAKVNA